MPGPPVKTRFFHTGRRIAEPAARRLCCASRAAITSFNWPCTVSRSSRPATPSAGPRAGGDEPGPAAAGSAGAGGAVRSRAGCGWLGPGPAEPSEASPSASRAAGGNPRPSANASKTDDARGLRLRLAHSLSRPWLMPVSSDIRPCVSPCAPRIMMTRPRSRLAHASSTSCCAKTRSTMWRTSKMPRAMARLPFSSFRPPPVNVNHMPDALATYIQASRRGC